MAQIKDIIVTAVEVKKDNALEQHLHDCIIAGDFEMLRTEQQAVADVLDRTKAKLEILKKTYERMKLANDRMPPGRRSNLQQRRLILHRRADKYSHSQLRLL